MNPPAGSPFYSYPHMLLIAVVTMFVWATPAYAWNEVGHKATAEIAFGLLSPEQQAAIGKILRAHPRFQEDFVAQMPAEIASGEESVQTLWIYQQASIWPDILRNLDDEQQDKYGPANWHYINMPIFLEDEDEKSLDGNLTHNMSINFEPPLKKNMNVIQALKGNLHVWNDVEVSDSGKAVALCWIFHLVGDMHQPLHSVALFSRSHFPEGDRGGNSIRIQRDPNPTNLHSIWDNLPDRFEDLEPGDLTKDVIRTDVVNLASIDYWLMRHAQLAKALVYSDEVRKQLLDDFSNNQNPEVELSEFYLANNALVAKEQVILAGHRMAAFLK